MAVAQPAVLADVWTDRAEGVRALGRQAVLVVGGAAFVGLAAQIAVPLPFTPVPLTLQTFAVLLAGAALGSLRGIMAMSLYAVAGMVGVPWFAEGSSGFALASFGYILGFIVAAGIVGRIAEHGATLSAWRTAGLMIIGNLAIYSIGVTWLKYAIDSTWVTALQLGVVPFLIGDALKIALAAGLLPLTWLGLRKAGLLR
ncbi:MAG: biotin transporter BioY [Candidatus Nanopelagicales bacterium]|jgi:biotin transport system substrate-specific component